MKLAKTAKNPRFIIFIIFIIFFLFGFTLYHNIQKNSQYSVKHEKFDIYLIADLDKKSKQDTPKPSWRSYLKTGTLMRNKDSDTYSLTWKEEHLLESRLGEGGRGMELSELILWNKMLLAFDDRSGIVFEVHNGQVIPRYILSTGNGYSQKGFKSEWATIKDGDLYVGSHGFEWRKDGKIDNYDCSFIKKISKNGKIEHINWKSNYDALREATNSIAPGYQAHEAVGWNEKYKRWYFLPRKISSEIYEEEKDETQASNKLISVDNKFKNVMVEEIGEYDNTKGFSSFKFIPSSPDEMIITKSLEVGDKTESYIMIVNFITKKILLPLTKFADEKYEGVEIIPQ
ncbi:soluble calcium-activated nucleotidase [Anaeramoeba flamelloides]|uniref:Soluble calcium-activated nucleotidase n=1 Tax=Anaeramoeba flamelloides TaxID=1746091 RepID=A0AAV8AHP4_9EUKA|nr:soluble calcium-activated nucleotidase [Anaeramoeba flamelloides]